MPLYLDVHHKINGLTTEGIADAHRKDLECQHKHGVNYLKYWFDEGTGKVFCLLEVRCGAGGRDLAKQAQDVSLVAPLPLPPGQLQRARADAPRRALVAGPQ